MKTIITIFVCVFIFSLENFGQNLDLPENHQLKNVYNLGPDAGFLLHTEADIMKRKKDVWQLHRYDESGKYIWSAEMDKSEGTSRVFPFVDEHNKITYALYINSMYDGGNTFFLKQINEKGNLREAKWVYGKDYPFNVFAFATQKNAFLIIETDVKNGLKKTRQYILQRYNLSMSKDKEVVLELENGVDGTWTYCGHTDNEFYMVYKTAVKNELTENIEVFNTEGKHVRTFKAVVDLGNRFPALSNKLFSNFNAANTYGEDIYFTGYSHPSGNGEISITAIKPVYANAFGGFQYNDATKKFYAFGLTSENETGLTALGTKYTGYYITVFDENGNRLQHIQNNFSGSLSSDNYLTQHASPDKRFLQLNILDENTLNLNITAGKKVYGVFHKKGSKMPEIYARELDYYIFENSIYLPAPQKAQSAFDRQLAKTELNCGSKECKYVVRLRNKGAIVEWVKKEKQVKVFVY